MIYCLSKWPKVSDKHDLEYDIKQNVTPRLFGSTKFDLI